MVPDIALAASAREWPDRLHRFLLDHGGGRIVDRVMAADQATSGGFDVLLIDDVCSFLTPRLVAVLKQSGTEVIGVYMPEDGPDAKRRLLECGISDVIETDATPEEFLSKIDGSLSHRVPVQADEDSRSTESFRIAVTGPCEGVGMTEIAIGLSRSLASDVETVLIDMDQNWPSIAQRLDLAVHPNIRTAVDHALHHMDRLDEAVHDVDGLSVVGGRADGGHGARITRPDAMMLMEGLSESREVVVADLGPLGNAEPGLLREFDTVIIVGTATPVGVARLIKTVENVLGSTPSLSVLAVVNKTGKGSFRRAEILGEIARTLPDVPVVTVPFDHRLEPAVWDGVVHRGGRYGKALRSMAGVVVRSLK
ncbi:MAG: CpaE family protein [Actinomycetota bacterium]